jgi:hypothetical protein
MIIAYISVFVVLTIAVVTYFKCKKKANVSEERPGGSSATVTLDDQDDN